MIITGTFSACNEMCMTFQPFYYSQAWYISILPLYAHFCLGIFHGDILKCFKILFGSHTSFEIAPFGIFSR